MDLSLIHISDGMLGQMMEPVVLPERVEQLPEKPWATTGHQGKRCLLYTSRCV